MTFKISMSMKWDKLDPEHLKSALKTCRPDHTVRFGDKADYYQSLIGKVGDLELNDKKIATIEIINVEKKFIYELNDDFIKNDTFSHYTAKEFYELLRKYYGRKLGWNMSSSVVCIIWYKIISIIQ